MYVGSSCLQYCSWYVSLTTEVCVIFKVKGYRKGCSNRSTINCVSEMCAVVNTVSAMCHPTPVKQLVAALTGDVKRLIAIKLDITPRNFLIPNSSSIYVPPDQSLPPQQPNPNSNSHPGSDPARGLQEAPSHPTDPTSEGNPGCHAQISILLTISHWMEIGPTAFHLSDGIKRQTKGDLC